MKCRSRKQAGPVALIIAGMGLLLATTGTARAQRNDLVLSRLGVLVGSANDPDAIGQNLEFRSLVSELGVVLAPRLLSPSDTLGFGGFQFAADLAFTTITSDASYWRVLSGSPDPSGTSGAAHGDPIQATAGMFVRKGMWLPLPSFEVGVGAVHLMSSRLWTAQGYAKLALHEGYHGWPLPSLALRGAASRMMGSTELDLTIISLDASMSKGFGVGGSLRLEPYAGWNMLIIVPRSEVIDKTPHMSDDRKVNFVFRDQDDILRTRIFGGLKLQHHVLALLLEANVALAGTSVDDRGVDADCAVVGMMTSNCNSTDQARAQQTYTVSVALDF